MTEAMVDDAMVEVTPEDREAGQLLLEQLHAIIRHQGGEVAGTTVKDDGYIVQALARRRLAGVAAGREEAARYLEAEAAHYRHAQDNANAPGDKLYRMGQKDACLLEATAIRQRGE